MCAFSFETGVWALLGLTACNFTDKFHFSPTASFHAQESLMNTK
jgi:hypothetical protein